MGRGLIILMLVLGLTPGTLFGQGGCIEIRSILVDACGSPEGTNEMVRFEVGGSSIDAFNDLMVDWPNNSWGGVIQNSQTADSVAYLNSTIQGCGHLIEPSGYILPAGSEVLLFTSYNTVVSEHSFAGLDDTLYVLFQNSTTSSGHFKNYCSSPCGSRTLEMWDPTKSNCGDTVVYYPDSLLLDQDGDRVDYSIDDDATYVNDGCTVPHTPLSVSANGDTTSICSSDSLYLNATIQGDHSRVEWFGGSGSFSDPDSSISYYSPGLNDSGSTDLYVKVVDPCASDSIYDTVQVEVLLPPSGSLTLNGNDSICTGDSVELIASGGVSYSWNTGETSNSIYASDSGTFEVTISNSCGGMVLDTTIGLIPSPKASISLVGQDTICPGDSVVLQASGNGTFIWDPGNIAADSLIVDSSGTYTLTASNACGSDDTSNTIYSEQSPDAAIINNEPLELCPGEQITLHGSGDGVFSWSPGGETTDSILVDSVGTYTLSVSNQCGTDDTSVVVDSGSAPVADITPDGPLEICKGVSVPLFANGNGSYSWSTGSTSDSILVDEEGTYVLEVANACGTDTDSVEVTVTGPNIVLNAAPTSGEPPLEVSFLAGGSGYVNQVWVFHDSSYQVLPATTYTYEEPGEYPVALVGVDSSGCIDTATTIIKVNEYQGLLIPNVFSPNQDGVNDIFAFEGSDIKSLECSIYNRWGEKIYYIGRMEQGWDGYTSAGKPVPEGVYFFKAEYTLEGGETKTATGDIQLVR